MAAGMSRAGGGDVAFNGEAGCGVGLAEVRRGVAGRAFTAAASVAAARRALRGPSGGAPGIRTGGETGETEDEQCIAVLPEVDGGSA